MNIAGYLKTSLNEYPGYVSAVVFTPSCNFKCPYCHNRNLVLPDPNLKIIPTKTVLKDIKLRRHWLDAVCISGGEPTLQPKLGNFLKEIKSLELYTLLETNGSNPQVIKTLLENNLVDCVALDIKGPLTREFYSQMGGERWLNAVLETIVLLRSSGKTDNYFFRTTVVPIIHTEKILLKPAKFFKAGETWHLQNFKPQNCLDSSFLSVKPFSQEEFSNMVAKVSSKCKATIYQR